MLQFAARDYILEVMDLFSELGDESVFISELLGEVSVGGFDAGALLLEGFHGD